MLLKDKTAVVTGCNRGIGKSILKCFAANGANLWACVRNKTNEFDDFCWQLEKDYSVKIKRIYFDLSKEEDVINGAKEILADKQPIDILINNAGMVPESQLFQMSPISNMKMIFEVNFFAQMLFTQYISRMMTRKKKGSIVNMSSLAALDGGPAQFEYVSSKAAIIGATKKLSIELGAYGVRVNVVAPGVTNTDMIKNMKDELLQHTLNSTVLKRPADPEEIANVVLFLATDLSSYITGQIIRVDGGFIR